MWPTGIEVGIDRKEVQGMQKDTIIRGMLGENTLRFSAISGRELVEKARGIHALSRTGSAALGRQLLMTALLSSDLKNEGDSVTTILSGNGVGGNMVCTGRFGALVKGYAANPEAELPPAPNGKLFVRGFVGDAGKLTVVRDMGLKEPYVGTCNLISGEIAEDFAQYLTVSEQKPSLVYLGVHENVETGEILSAGGLVLEAMPDCPDEDIEMALNLAAFVSDMALRLQEGESLKDILGSIFGRMGIAYTEKMVPAYSCDCSRERMEQALISLGEQELTGIIEEDGQAELVCHFCNKKYAFDKEALEALLKEATGKNG